MVKIVKKVCYNWMECHEIEFLCYKIEIKKIGGGGVKSF
jgi:hypothetical protein